MKLALVMWLILVAVWAQEASAQGFGIRVGPYGQEVSKSYTVANGLLSEEVYGIGVDSAGRVLAGTAQGLARFSDGRWAPVAGLEGMPVAHFVPDDLREGWLWVVSEGTLYSLWHGKLKEVAPVPPGAVNALAVAKASVLLGTEVGLFTLAGRGCQPVNSLNEQLLEIKAVRDIAVFDKDVIAVAGEAGLFLSRRPNIWQRLHPRDGDRAWTPRDVRAVTFDAEGRLWFASVQGVGCLDGEAWTLYAGSDGLPYNDFTCAAVAPDGVVWFGTHLGAIRLDGRTWAYREGKRWLPANDVRGIVAMPNGEVWFATPAGIGVIRRRTMTLAEKAQFFEDEIDKRHRRTPYQYVQSVRLERPGDKGVWIQRDDDNDGQYTGMYGAAECFAYAATKDPKAKARATKAFEALRFLSQVTQGGSHPAPRGFPARTILLTSGPDPNQSPAYSVEADRKQQRSDALWKVIHPRWPTSADGRWYWKCDTSSDELDGHFFLYALYYDLVAETEEEKARVRDMVRDITDHLIEHDFRLVDWDGKPTRWANFSPDSLNRDPDWWSERGLNSLSILTYLRIAEHVTGDTRYGAAFDRLVREESYAMNAMYPKVQRGPGSFVQFDDEMAFMNYYNLLRLEKDPQLRQMFAYSCFQYWELEACERNPFYNFAYAACCEGETFTSPWGVVDLKPKKRRLEEAVDTLERYPLDRINWRHTNSHRIDIVPLPAYVREPGEAIGCGCRIDGTVLPVDERHLHLWADDPWRLDTGGQGDVLEDGAAFLLAYYMGLYHGYIVQEEAADR